MVQTDGAPDHNEHLGSCQAFTRALGENIIAWMITTDCDVDRVEGEAVLSGHRLCFRDGSHPAETCPAVPVLGEALPYAPIVNGGSLLAELGSHGSSVSFIVDGEPKRAY